MAREVPLLLLLTLSAVLSVEGYSHFNEIKEKDVCTGDSVVGAVSSFPGNHVEGPASEVAILDAWYTVVSNDKKYLFWTEDNLIRRMDLSSPLREVRTIAGIRDVDYPPDHEQEDFWEYYRAPIPGNKLVIEDWSPIAISPDDTKLYLYNNLYYLQAIDLTSPEFMVTTLMGTGTYNEWRNYWDIDGNFLSELSFPTVNKHIEMDQAQTCSLDYRFQGNLEPARGNGPALMGRGDLTDDGYKFDQNRNGGEGLRLGARHGDSCDFSDEWTVAVDFTMPKRGGIDPKDNYQRVMGAENWGDDGLYLDEMYPVFYDELYCDFEIEKGVPNQMVVAKRKWPLIDNIPWSYFNDELGANYDEHEYTLALYWNGTLCDYIWIDRYEFPIWNNEHIDFFRDDSREDLENFRAATVHRITLQDRGLEHFEIANNFDIEFKDGAMFGGRGMWWTRAEWMEGMAITKDGSTLYLSGYSYGANIMKYHLPTKRLSWVLAMPSVVKDSYSRQEGWGSGIALSPDEMTIYKLDGNCIWKVKADNNPDEDLLEDWYSLSSKRSVLLRGGEAVASDCSDDNSWGYQDGTGSEARFEWLEGSISVSPDGKTLYVADWEDAHLRAIDLHSNNVRTIAGNGEWEHVDKHPFLSTLDTTQIWGNSVSLSRDGTTLFVLADEAIRNVTLDQHCTILATGESKCGEVTGVVTTAGSFGSGYGPEYRGSASADSFEDYFDTAAFSPDGKTMYAWATDICVIFEFDMTSPFPRKSAKVLAGARGACWSNDGVGDEARIGSSEISNYQDISGGGMVVSPDGKKLYFTNDDAIRVVDVKTRRVTTIAGSSGSDWTEDGIMMHARFRQPTGLAISHDGRILYVGERFCVRKIDLVEDWVETIHISSVEEEDRRDLEYDRFVDEEVLTQKGGDWYDLTAVHLSKLGETLYFMTAGGIWQLDLASKDASLLSGETYSEGEYFTADRCMLNTFKGYSKYLGLSATSMALSPDGSLLYFPSRIQNRIMAVDVMTGVEHMIAGKMYWANNMFSGPTTFCGVETSLAELGEEDSANPLEATFNFPGSVSITPDGSTLFVVSWGRSLPSNDARGSPRIREIALNKHCEKIYEPCAANPTIFKRCDWTQLLSGTIEDAAAEGLPCPRCTTEFNIRGKSTGMHRWGLFEYKTCTLPELDEWKLPGNTAGHLGMYAEAPRFETYVCIKNHPCSQLMGEPELGAFCFVMDKEQGTFIPWATANDLGIFVNSAGNPNIMCENRTEQNDGNPEP